MGDQMQTIAVCNVCYRCREYITISDDNPLMKRKILIFSRIHGSHPHGFNPQINLARYRCVDSAIESMIVK